MIYAQVGPGSKGIHVKELQKNLNQNGYKLSEDGVFGNETKKAVEDYQSQNGLDVDGIVGEQTWGSLTGGANNANKNKGFTYDEFTYDDYAESETVSQALATLDSQLGAKPGDYQSTWQGKIDSIIDKILNREDFSYDLNSDALYQQYKDQYTQQGKLAMADTMGQAAALTGGYGSSYATAAGNQAYQAYLSQLNEVVPELYGMALDRYNQEGEELYNNYALLADQESQEYGRHQDEYNKWLNETQLAYDRYDTERNFDYNDYINDLNMRYGIYSDDKSYAYNDYRNAIEDAKWQKEFDLQKEKWDFEKAAYSKADSSGGGSPGAVKGAVAGAINGGGSPDDEGDKAPGGDDVEPSVDLTSIRTQLDSLKSNKAVEAKLEALESTGVIDHKTALQLMSEYMDTNEKYVEDDAGNESASYKDMIKNTSGWVVKDDGGVNLFGIDRNARVETPTGEILSLNSLREKLIGEGMKHSDATNAIKKLQQNLDISTNWMFGW